MGQPGRLRILWKRITPIKGASLWRHRRGYSDILGPGILSLDAIGTWEKVDAVNIGTAFPGANNNAQGLPGYALPGGSSEFLAQGDALQPDEPSWG